MALLYGKDSIIGAASGPLNCDRRKNSSFSTSGNGRELFREGRYDRPGCGRGDRTMDYFAGLDISMDETHVCVLDREGVVVRESKTESSAQAVANELSKAPSCRRIVFETGRMAPILFHGLNQLGLPVVCVVSRQAYQALKSLATHKHDRNDARGLAHLARTGFFKPVHVKSLRAHALRSLISARKKLVGQRVTLENQIRGLAVVFGVRLPRALTATFIDQTLRASDRIRLDIVINAARKQAGLVPRGSLNETHGYLGAKARMRCGF